MVRQAKAATFIKDWSLPTGVAAGVVIYFIYMWIPLSDGARAATHEAVGVIQPVLIFLMLFLSMCKVDIRDLRPAPWDKWLLLVQSGSFIILSAVVLLTGDPDWKTIAEGAMLAMICPTATAASVITDKLGGIQARTISYTILINLLVSVLIPLLCPVIHPHESLEFLQAFLLMLVKVFPMLILPLILSIMVRHRAPGLHRRILARPNLAFVIWVISLPLAIAEAVKCMFDTHITLALFIGLLLISGVSCFIQFFIGKRIGGHYNDSITAGQALGQKNTVFIIWLGYTFFTPVTAAVGGFYSIFHNLFNAWQLYRKKKRAA